MSAKKFDSVWDAVGDNPVRGELAVTANSRSIFSLVVAECRFSIPKLKSVALLLIHLLVLIAKSLRSGGIKAVVAENLLLKQQLNVLGRSRCKAPNLETSDPVLKVQLGNSSMQSSN